MSGPIEKRDVQCGRNPSFSVSAVIKENLLSLIAFIYGRGAIEFTPKAFRKVIERTLLALALRSWIRDGKF
jgi:hypothetical protein